MLKLVVYATHSDGYFDILINQAKKLNYTIEILGWKDKWLGFYKRTLDLYNFLKLQPNNDIILCIDGFDSMILEDKDRLLQKFYSFNSPIVWGIEHNDVIKPFIFKSNFNYTVNGGSFIGYNYQLKLVFKEIIKKFGTKNYKQDDQKIINWMNNNNKIFQELVKLDVDSHIFANITYDCHFLNQTGLLEYEGLQIQNISLGTDLIEKAKTIFNGEKFEIIGPDEGSRYLVEGHGGKNLKKVRKEYAAKKVSYRDVHEITGDLDVKGKNVLILDDMISSGSTMVKALEKLTEAGAKNIACAATHGLFLFDCLDKMRQFTRHIISSDTILNSQAEVSIKQHLTNL
jgi:hypothetical protein